MALAPEALRPGEGSLEPVVKEPSELHRPGEAGELKDLEGRLEGIERTPGIQPIVDDGSKQVVLTPTQGEEPEITLPLSQVQLQQGLHQKAWSGLRWIAEQCIRIVKKAALTGARVVYRK